MKTTTTAAKSFEISNPTSGLILGTYLANTREEALDALALDAGYKSFAESCEVTGEDGSDLNVREVAA